MRYFLDTQLYSYLANGAISRREWLAALEGRELWLSAVTGYELLEGLVHASPHTYPISLAALEEAARIPAGRILPWPGKNTAAVGRWLARAGRGPLPKSFYDLRRRVEAGRRSFLGQIRGFLGEVMPHERRSGDPLFSYLWRARAGRRRSERLDAAFVFQTAVLVRALRIRYAPERHPSDYLDYLQLKYLARPGLAFITADARLVRMTSRSLQSDRIILWSDLRPLRLGESGRLR